MVLFLTIVLLLSCLGMVVILWVKDRELRTGRVFFVGLRPAMEGFFSKLLAVERTLPRALAIIARGSGSRVRAVLHAGTAWVVVVVERLLERALNVLRYKTSAPEARGEASPFLREVAEYKKQILQDVPQEKSPE